MLLLPPSEGKAPGGHGAPWARADRSFPQLDAARVAVRDAVRAVLAAGDDGTAGRLLGARGATLQRARADWDDLDDAPTMPAAHRYSGVTWAALAPGELAPAARTALRERVVIPSGLWGLLRAGDPIPAYRVKMGARVAPLGVLARHWRPLIAPHLGELADGGWVVDLLPVEHRAAIDPAGLGTARLVRVDLVAAGPSETVRAVGHAGKTLRGLLARAILAAGARTPLQLARLSVPGLRPGEVSHDDAGTRIVFSVG